MPCMIYRMFDVNDACDVHGVHDVLCCVYVVDADGVYDVHELDDVSHVSVVYYANDVYGVIFCMTDVVYMSRIIYSCRMCCKCCM